MAGRAAASRVAARTPRDGQAAVASVCNHAPHGLLTVRRRMDSCSADSRATRRYDGARSGRVRSRHGIHSEPGDLRPVAHLPLESPGVSTTGPSMVAVRAGTVACRRSAVQLCVPRVHEVHRRGPRSCDRAGQHLPHPHARRGVSDPGQDLQPLALYRVYATREGGRWVLANALPRVTRRWNHETIGRVTFVYPPTRRFVRARAQATAVFVDSLARAFQVPPPPTIGYYFTDDLIETLGAAGLEFFPLGGDTVGGRSNAPDHLVFIGSSSNGEGYRHELAHVILWPFLAPLQAAGLVQEGLMTWTGGSAALDFRDLMPGLKLYLDAHPDLTLERVVTDPPPRSGSLDVGYDGLAVLCQMVYDVGGLAGVRSLASAGRDPSAVLGTAARVLNAPHARLDRLWRDRAAAF